MERSKNDRWLDVLAGRDSANDVDTRQAESLRRYFDQHAVESEQLDPQATKRMANLLDSRLAAMRSQALRSGVQKPASPRNLLQAAWDWLFPAGGGHAGRYAGMAAAVLALVAGPIMYHQWEQQRADDDGLSMKGLPPGGTASGPSLSEVTDLRSANPDAEAMQLLATLTKLGVAASMKIDGDDRWVEAQVAPSQMATTEAALKDAGLILPANGHLVVRWRKQR